MKFLYRDNYSVEINKFLSKCDKSYVAVAFLGEASFKLFEKSNSHQINIICNLESGACNPFVVEKLMALKNVNIKSLPSLHAKLLLNGSTLITGSANLSANGLCLQDSEINGWEETGLLTTHNEAIEDARTWYAITWDQSHFIDENDIVLAKEKWLFSRGVRGTNSTAKSLADLINKDISFLSDRRIYLAFYRDEASKEACEKADELAKSYGSTPEFYEDWDELPDGADLISVGLGPKNGFDIDGIYFTPLKPQAYEFKTADGSVSSIKICTKESDFMGIKITAEDQRLLKNNKDVVLNHKNYRTNEAFLIPLTDWVDAVNKSME
ncbi:phospholipase D family protein [Moritella sp. F3]|uniref:phospholipase D family protein n=1 Tax=Moritella sp. F3 TaxID=2718882 RepID=UPI0018E0E61D|nr:phospholipase D family protein [Moritella sp. F3]GIC75605.1 hypothetical protein FMO001_03320 [Moritella sp. F1]GIC80750.1 hypothetical protein FMO003_10310 [Moritella sp. F3]